MCWSSEDRRINDCHKVAKNDLHVIKIMSPSDKPGKYSSYFENFTYEDGKAYKAIDFPTGHEWDGYNNDYVCIFTGFHSYSVNCKFIRKTTPEDIVCVYSPENYKKLEYYELNDAVFVDCVIPKGTRYYVNSEGEYVSKEIKVIGKKEIKYDV